MLDLRYVRENPQAVAENCRNRGVEADVDLVVGLADRRSELIQELNEFKQQRNLLAKSVGGERDLERRQNLIGESRRIKEVKPEREAERQGVAGGLRGDAVLLELGLIRYALDMLIERGYEPTITPDLARDEALVGTGFIPRGPETQIYSIEDSDLSLVATAEITLAGSLAGEILDEEKLPLRLAGLSHCFRTEAGSHGRASRGLYRVHQFTKVEMFGFTAPEEIPNSSNTPHTQQRRLRIRYRKNGGPPHPPPPHTGTAIAVSRALIPL